MSSEFKDTLKVDASSNEITSGSLSTVLKTPYEFGTTEHSLWLIEQYSRDNKLYLGRLNYLITALAEHIKEQFPNIKIYWEGRLKSKKSSVANVKQGKNLYDTFALRGTIIDVLSKYTPEKKLQEAIDLIESTDTLSDSPQITKLLQDLRKVLQIKANAKDNLIGNYHLSFLDKPETAYSNIEVLFVDALKVAIKELSHYKGYSHISKCLENAISSTNYGASLDVFSNLMPFLKFQLDGTVIYEDRYKAFKTNNGYTSRHMNYIDISYGIPVEIQVMSRENHEIADKGSASHQNRDGKQRILDAVPINATTEKGKFQELIRFFSPDRISDIVDTIPRYTSYDSNAR